MGKVTLGSLWECDRAEEKGSSGNGWCLIGWFPSQLLLHTQDSLIDSYDQRSKN